MYPIFAQAAVTRLYALAGQVLSLHDTANESVPLESARSSFADMESASDTITEAVSIIISTMCKLCISNILY